MTQEGITGFICGVVIGISVFAMLLGGTPTEISEAKAFETGNNTIYLRIEQYKKDLKQLSANLDEKFKEIDSKLEEKK